MSAHFFSSPMGLKPLDESSLAINNDNHQSGHPKLRLIPAALLGAIMMLPCPAIAADATDSAPVSSPATSPTASSSPSSTTPAELSKVIVAGNIQSEITPTAELAAAVLSEIPGGTS